MWSARAYPVDLRSGAPRESGAGRTADLFGSRATSSKSCIRRGRPQWRPRSSPSSRSTSAGSGRSQCCASSAADERVTEDRRSSATMTFGALPLAVFLSAGVSPIAMQLLDANGDLKRLPEFVDCLLTSDPPLTCASAIVEQVVFTPKHLDALLTSHHLVPECRVGRTIVAAEVAESTALLEALLADWLDFFFEPSPPGFVLFADHDEYTTLFAGVGTLRRRVGALKQKGFVEVSNYVRQL